MKRSIHVGMGSLVVVALVIGTMVYAEGETNSVACPCPYHSGSAVMKDANIAVQNTADGVTITVTAANAEQVKAIQTAFANFGKSTNAPCAMVDAAACKKAHAAGSCGGHGVTKGTEGHHQEDAH